MGEPIDRSSLAKLPNFISALRLPIAAAFVAVDDLLWRGVLLFLGALTDALDGWLARRLGVESKAGAIMDPAFDKLFVLITLAALASPEEAAFVQATRDAAADALERARSAAAKIQTLVRSRLESDLEPVS